ncbi:MAG: hypothetical protein ABIJ59_13145 [Pseudomonadota bacterium]
MNTAVKNNTKKSGNVIYIHPAVEHDLNKDKKTDLQSRVLYLRDAIDLLKDFFDKTPPPPPSVEERKVYAIDETDPIFDSLRQDYKGFDDWLQKCKREHRNAYVIKDKGNLCLAGICIHKKEDGLLTGESGKTLKLCTFKVSDHQHGNQYLTAMTIV